MRMKEWFKEAWEESHGDVMSHPTTCIGRFRLWKWHLWLEWYSLDLGWRMMVVLLMTVVGLMLVLGSMALIIIHQLLGLVGC